MRTNRIMLRIIQVATFVAVLPVFLILIAILAKGLGTLDLAFLVNNPLDEQVGIANAIKGSLAMTGIALLISAPIGIAAAIFLNEYASTAVQRIGDTLVDILLGVPSIVAGLFIFLLVVPALGYNGYAGALALSVLMTPVVIRTTQEVLRLVPAGLREASLALGVPMWRTTIFVTCRTALSGILTGLVLALSRGIGETAPLLLTAQGSNDSVIDLGAPLSSMTIVIYNNTISSDPIKFAQAWTCALVLFAIALTLNVLIRFKTINSRVL
jgi:phosphate transport system permease protein